MTPEQIAEVLEDAAALIEKGWTRHRIYRPVFGRGHAYCASGAIRHAAWCQWSDAVDPVVTTGTPTSEQVERVFVQFGLDPEDAFCTSYNPASLQSYIACWNDAEGRTKQEVLDTFHKVAKQVQMGVSD